MRRIRFRARWAVPAGAVAVTGIVIAAATVASADSAPSLPSRTPEQLLTGVAQGTAKPLGPLTATVQETSNLGLPALPLPSQQDGSAGMTAGSQSVSIWYRDAQHIRVAKQVQAGETDLRLDGRTMWVWNSKTQTATRYSLPAQAPHARSDTPGSSMPGTPQAAAAQLLKAIGPTTVVSVQRNVYVAGRAAYQLSLVPRSSKSLVGSVLIAIDASRHILLRVQVYPRGSTTVAYSVGFTALSFGTPAASNFSFTPPPGATVKNVTVPGNLKRVLGPAGLGPAGLGPAGLGGPLLGGPLLRSTIMGSTAFGRHFPAGGGFVVPGGPARPALRVIKTRTGKLVEVIPALPKRALEKIEARFAESLPASMTKAQRAAAIKSFDQHLLGRHILGRHVIARLQKNGGGWYGYSPLSMAAARAKTPHVIGTGWLSVFATPPNPMVAAAVQQALHGGPGVGQPAGPNFAVLQALLKAAVPVHGSWGSGRLLKTTLLSVLITSKGQILTGAVTPPVLYADVAADAG